MTYLNLEFAQVFEPSDSKVGRIKIVVGDLVIYIRSCLWITDVFCDFGAKVDKSIHPVNELLNRISQGFFILN